MPPPSPPPPSPSPSLEGTVVLTLTASGSVNDFSDNDKLSLQQWVADAAGVDKSLVTINVTAASVRITATIAVPESMDANQVKNSLSSSLGTADAASTALGITVEEVPTIIIIGEDFMTPPDPSESTCDGGCIVGITAAVAVLALVFVGWLSGWFARIGCPSPLKKTTKPVQPSAVYPSTLAREEI